MSVFDDTDRAYGSGRCCWCGRACWTWGGCHIPYRAVHDSTCKKCKEKHVPTVDGVCAECYRKD